MRWLLTQITQRKTSTLSSTCSSTHNSSTARGTVTSSPSPCSTLGSHTQISSSRMPLRNSSSSDQRKESTRDIWEESLSKLLKKWSVPMLEAQRALGCPSSSYLLQLSLFKC